MRNDYSLHSVTFKPTIYRDESAFRPTSGKWKTKRWEITSIFREDDYEDGVTHPEDEFIDRGDNVSFTEWRKVGEDFNPQDALLNLIQVFEEMAELDKHYKEGFKSFVKFCQNYGNDMNSTLCEDYAVSAVSYFGKVYKLPTLNILPFVKARDRYWNQTYLFYSNCKLLTVLFDPSHYANILGDLDDFKANKFKVIVDGD